MIEAVPDFFNLDILLKLVVALVLGGMLGLERTLSGKTAGLRTYALVSLGSALFVITGQLLADYYFKLGLVNFDPLRVASQIVLGIGFLGTGLIVLRHEKLEGLTTAAGLWVAAGLGMAAGFGLYRLATSVTVIVLLIFTVLWSLERFFNKYFTGED